MQWLGGVLDKHQSAEHMDRCDAHFDAWGHGRYVLERRADGAFLGYCGIARIWPGLPVDGVEIGWRLVRDAWGYGYVTEAARAAIAEGFDRFDFDEVLAFTADANLRSRAVMARASLLPDPARDFEHPQLAEGDPLRRHLVFSAKNPGRSAG
jgi:RimJ/RimL family protein N-acetyltransferase